MSDNPELTNSPRETTRLRATAKPIDKLTVADRDQMFALLCESFENVDRERFESDLNEKHSVVVLTPPDTKTIAGFSTLMTLRAVVDDDPIVALFAGDTVVAAPYRGHSTWMRFWLRHALELAEQQPEPLCYGLLLTCVPVSYRCLTAFFREYYPCPNVITPPRVQRHLEALVRLKFPVGFSTERGTVTPPTPLPWREYAHPYERVRHDAASDFFAQRNPSFFLGEFLACISAFSRTNLTPYGLKMVRQIGD